MKAFQNGKSNKVKALQGLLTRSLSARVLAVARVSSSKGARTPGIDGICWNSSASKMAGALSLWKKGYKALPLRRVNIAKPGSKKKRPLGIPTIRDRAMQALYLMALDPISEAGADTNSYGFRKHRATHDAIDQAFRLLSRKNSACWVLDADIKGCFDNISHDWMLNNIPVDKSVLRQWLKCGYVEAKGKLFPTTAGTPQGGIDSLRSPFGLPVGSRLRFAPAASPCLCNMVLDGLEPVVKTAVKSGRQINFVRYADDFIVTARHRSDLENFILPAITRFHRERGLTLSEEKTHIRHIGEGFDFLGQHLRKYSHGKLWATPSKRNVKAFLAKVRQELRSCRGQNAGQVIARLNPKIRGWANYHRHGVSLDRYIYVDHQIFEAVYRFLKRSHPNKSGKWIYRKYFRRDPAQNGRKMLSFQESKVQKDGSVITRTRYLKAAATTQRSWHLKVRGNANPYEPHQKSYFKWLRGLRKVIKEGKWKPYRKAGRGLAAEPLESLRRQFGNLHVRC